MITFQVWWCNEPTSFVEAVKGAVDHADWYHGTGVLEGLKLQHAELVNVVAAIAAVLTEEQQENVAVALGIKVLTVEPEQPTVEEPLQDINFTESRT